MIVSGVGDPFLNQEIRYHCPIYGIFKFSKPKFVSFTRHIWNYDQGNYDLLRNKATSFDWDFVRDNDTNIYANNISVVVTSHKLTLMATLIGEVHSYSTHGIPYADFCAFLLRIIKISSTRSTTLVVHHKWAL